MNRTDLLIAILFTCFAITSIIIFLTLVSASCLTDIEIANIRAVATNSSVNPDILQNIFERLCNSQYTIEAINSFNSSMSAKIDTLSNVTSQRIDTLNTQVQATLNNSALVQTLTQISTLYNSSIASNNKFTEMEGRINARMDNQSLDMLNQINQFKDTVNQQLVEKQTNNLTTNRIILIVLGAVVLIGGFWYFSRKKLPYKPHIENAPFDMRKDLLDIKERLNEKQPIHSSKNKRLTAG